MDQNMQIWQHKVTTWIWKERFSYTAIKCIHFSTFVRMLVTLLHKCRKYVYYSVVWESQTEATDAGPSTKVILELNEPHSNRCQKTRIYQTASWPLVLFCIRQKYPPNQSTNTTLPAGFSSCWNYKYWLLVTKKHWLLSSQSWESARCICWDPLSLLPALNKLTPFWNTLSGNSFPTHTQTDTTLSMITIINNIYYY